MLTKITFDQLLPIWRDKLWPGRVSKIESTSAMKFLGGYDMANMTYEPYCVGWIIGDRIVGVNSGHQCADNSYRSRGVWVDPMFRHFGFGTALLVDVVNQAKRLHCEFVWSLPKKSAWRMYERVGFSLSSEWHQTELDTNAYAKLDLTYTPSS